MAGRWQPAVAGLGTLFVIVALAVLPLLTPLFTHAAIDAAGSTRLLGLEPATVHDLSDRSVAQLVAGGDLELRLADGRPFYDAAERDHLADARALLWLALAAGAISAVAIAGLLAAAAGGGRARLWSAVSRAGAVAAVAVVVIGVVGLVAFGTLFTLFHQLFFPGGGWAFDPGSQRLVQLYPLAFWQVAATAFGILVALLGAAAWWLGRRMARRPIVAPMSVMDATPGDAPG